MENNLCPLPNELIGEIRNLQVSFGNQPVIKEINLSLHRHKIHVISGPSGSGKTTLLRSLNRLNECFPQCHTRGDINLQLDGKLINIQQMSSAQLPTLRQKAAMVFQNPNVLPGSIASNILLPLKVVHHIKGGAAHEKLHLALQKSHLWDEVKDRLQHSANSLSGGQQQRLCLARALALNPEILLLDEPTSSLDPEVGQQIEELILELANSYTIIMVSHSRRQITQLADFSIPMDHGRIINPTSR